MTLSHADVDRILAELRLDLEARIGDELSIDRSRGFDKWPDYKTMYWCAKPNGTATIQIHINGGATDTVVPE